MEPLSGNGSDKKILPNSIEAVRSLHGKTVIPFTVEGALATPEPPVATTPCPFPCRPGARTPVAFAPFAALALTLGIVLWSRR